MLLCVGEGDEALVPKPIIEHALVDLIRDDHEVAFLGHLYDPLKGHVPEPISGIFTEEDLRGWWNTEIKPEIHKRFSKQEGSDGAVMAVIPVIGLLAFMGLADNGSDDKKKRSLLEQALSGSRNKLRSFAENGILSPKDLKERGISVSGSES